MWRAKRRGDPAVDAIRSENADMSNDNAGEKPAPRMTKGSRARLIRPG